MLPLFRLGVGGPVAGGRQYISWIHRDDLVGIILAALADERWRARSTRRRPSRSATASSPGRSAGRCGRPSLLPVPGAALRLLYGEMAEIVTTGARVVPAKPLVLGYEFRHPRLPEALTRRAGASLGGAAMAPGGAQAGAGTPSRGRAGGFWVSMITRQGRLLNRYAAVGPIRCSPVGAWIADQ